MPPLHRLLLRLAIGLCVLAAKPASAQIYSWRDGSGNLVLSNHPQGGPAGSYVIVVAARGAVDAQARAGMPQAPGRMSRRAVAFDDAIVLHAAANGVRPELVRAVIQAESAFDPRARSPKGAMGLMQLMPATAAAYGVEDPYDPRENIRAGVAYLKTLLVRYDDREELALAAYNAGPGAVDKYGAAVPPYRETIDYVDRITTASKPAGPPPFRLYRVVEVVDGREIVKYTNVAVPGAALVRR